MSECACRSQEGFPARRDIDITRWGFCRDEEAVVCRVLMRGTVGAPWKHDLPHNTAAATACMASQMTNNAEKHGFSEKICFFPLKNTVSEKNYGLLNSVSQDNPAYLQKNYA